MLTKQGGVTPAAGERNGIQVIRRAASVLRAVGGHSGGLRLGELAERVDLPKATVHRIVRALADEQLLVADTRGSIRIGPVIATLAPASWTGVVDQLHPLLVELRDTLGETVDLSVLDEGAVVRFVDQVECAHRLRAISAVGVRLPLHCTANGKALLAALPPAEASRLLPSVLEGFTPNTIVDRGQLDDELALIRQGEAAFDRGEHSVGIIAVGAAVHGAGGPLAAISIPVPVERFADNEPMLAAAVLGAAASASALLRGAAPS